MGKNRIKSSLVPNAFVVKRAINEMAKQTTRNCIESTWNDNKKKMI